MHSPDCGVQYCQESTAPTVQATPLHSECPGLSPSSRGLASDDVHAPDGCKFRGVPSNSRGRLILSMTLQRRMPASRQSRQIREAAMKAHAEVSIRDRIEDSVRARPRTQTVLRADDVIMVWKTNPPSKRGRWVGPGVCIRTHRGSVWVNMRGSRWKCSQLQCKLATTEESRGLEIQNQLLDDMNAEFEEFPGRRVYTDCGARRNSTVGCGPSSSGAVVQEEEDRTSALIPTLPPVTSPSLSLPELDSESHHSFREALQGREHASSV